MGQSENSYDAFPYPSNPYSQSHPDRLAAVGRLFGIDVPDREHARVLEIGCASGGNLIPMASQLPNASFLGVDLSEKQVEQGRRKIAEMGLTNVVIEAQDIVEARAGFDRFDYIICHGVFSWVPPDVQQAILEICRDHLSDFGIAFISYNTFPGWHFRGMIRDMMCFHDNDQGSPAERVTQARALLKFLADSVSAESSAYGMLLSSELELLSKHNDAYIFHEHLEPNNLPLYFNEFMKLASDQQLQYVGDSTLSTMWIGNFSSDVAATLQRIAPDIVQREQYTDFVRNRLFRQSLLCHEGVVIDRTLGAEKLDDSFVVGRFAPEGEASNVDLAPSVSVSFQVPGTGRKISTSEPIVKAALVHLANAWPSALAFEDLFQTSRLSIGAHQIEDAQRAIASRADLANHLLRLHVSGLLEVKFDRDRFVGHVSERPAVSAYARYQAVSANQLTNQRHEIVSVDDFVRNVCQAMDGTRDKVAIVQFARELVDRGKLVVHRTPETSSEQLDQLLQQAVDQALQKMSRQALLCS